MRNRLLNTSKILSTSPLTVTILKQILEASFNLDLSAYLKSSTYHDIKSIIQDMWQEINIALTQNCLRFNGHT